MAWHAQVSQSGRRVRLGSALVALSLLACGTDDSNDLAAAFRHAESNLCAQAGSLVLTKTGDPALAFYFGAYCWPEDTPWSECIPFKKGFTWGPPPENCFAEVAPHLACLSALGSEASCSGQHPVSFECSPLIGEKPLGAPQDCTCKSPTFYADYQGTSSAQEFRERQSGCGAENLSFELRCAILDEACGTSCGCYREGAFEKDVYVPSVHDMSFRGDAWLACGFPVERCH